MITRGYVLLARNIIPMRILIALVLLQVGLVAAEEPQLQPEPTGAFTYAGVHFDLLLQGPGLLVTSQAVQPDSGWPHQDQATWETHGTIPIRDGVNVGLVERLVRRDDGGCDVELHLTASAPVGADTVALVAALPAADFAGRWLGYNDGREVLPVVPGGAMLPAHWKAGISTISVPLASGTQAGHSLFMRGDFMSAVADERVWNQPRFGLRLLAVRPAADSLSSATLRFSLGVAAAVPVRELSPASDLPATLAGGVRVPVDLAAWELPPSWAVASAVVPEGDGGRQCLRFATTMRRWGFQPTRKFLYPRDIARVVFTGRMKVQDVIPGTEVWQKARAQLRFLDLQGEQVGGWPATTNLDGTHDWTPFHQEHACPPSTRFADMWLGMAVASGTAWYDDLQLAAYDAQGAAVLPIATPTEVHSDTTGWWSFAPGAEDAARPLVIDFSAWMPAPAGRFGQVVARDGHLAFAAGGRARFWGAGAATWCPAKEDSPRIVGNLARAGINLVRLHGMDAMNRAESIFDPASERTDRLDPAKLDRLDSHVANLRQRGIYLDINLLTKRRFLAADGVRDADLLPEGGKAAALFNRRLIDLQKDYARLLLTHVNPYTGLAYKDDPAVALVEIVNETSLFTLGFMGGLPPSYEVELDGQFTAWCTSQKVTRPTGAIAALLAQKPIPADAARFCEDVTAAYYQEMSGFLKHELGLKALVMGTSYAYEGGEKRIQAGLDVVDAHAYHDHPSGGWSPTSVFTNRPMIRSYDNLIGQLARERVAGKPFTISEWNCVWSNQYITEGPLLVAAYAGFQEWDAPMAFSVNGIGWRPRMEGCWENDDKPHVMAAAAAAALMFYRGDVAPGPQRLVTLSSVAPGVTVGGFLAAQGHGAEQALLTNRIALSLDAQPGAQPPAASVDGRLASADGQIRWDVHQGLFILDTPRTQAVLGFSGGQPASTGAVGFVIANPFAQVIVTALDEAPIASSHHLLITATAQAENTAQAYRLFFKGLVALGHGPILIEPVRAQITLRRAGPAPAVSVVDWYGRRTAVSLPVVAAPGGGWTVALGGTPGSWFEVVWP